MLTEVQSGKAVISGIIEAVAEESEADLSFAVGNANQPLDETIPTFEET